MIKFDKKTCMVIVSTDEIKYQTRVSNIIAFGSPWSITTSISFYNKKPCLCYAYIKQSLLFFACADSNGSGEIVTWIAASEH